VHKGGKTLQAKTSKGRIGSPIPPSNDSFPLHLRGMYRQSRPGTGTYLDVRRYAAIDARTDAPHKYGARLGFVDIAGNIKVPRPAQQFRTEMWHRTFPEGPDNPAYPAGRHSFAVGCIGVHSLHVPKDKRREKGSITTLPGASSQRPLPTTFGRKCSNSQITCTGIGKIMSLGIPICHLHIVLLPPLVTKVL
jgi:hypothetical protein